MHIVLSLVPVKRRSWHGDRLAVVSHPFAVESIPPHPVDVEDDLVQGLYAVAVD